MAKMFHDMEEDVVRRRIAKARDTRSNDKNRLKDALELVDLVDRLLECGCLDEAKQAEEFKPSLDEESGAETVQGESEPTTQEELETITDAPEVVGETDGRSDE